MEIPRALDPLLVELDSMTPGRLAALADGFAEAEASAVQSARRAVARHLAMNPDTPEVIAILAGQLALSEAMLSWEAVYGLDEDTSYSARAAVLDMGLVLCDATMGETAAEALAGPWLAALNPG